MLLGKMSGINVLKLFNAWAVNGPEYFPDLHETAQYDLLPESNSRGQGIILSWHLHLGKSYYFVFSI